MSILELDLSSDSDGETAYQLRETNYKKKCYRRHQVLLIPIQSNCYSKKLYWQAMQELLEELRQGNIESLDLEPCTENTPMCIKFNEELASYRNGASVVYIGEDESGNFQLAIVPEKKMPYVYVEYDDDCPYLAFSRQLMLKNVLENAVRLGCPPAHLKMLYDMTSDDQDDYLPKVEVLVKIPPKTTLFELLLFLVDPSLGFV